MINCIKERTRAFDIDNAYERASNSVELSTLPCKGSACVIWTEREAHIR